MPRLADSLYVSTDTPLINVVFETAPLDATCDQRVKVVAQPLQIVYDSATIMQAVNLFAPPKDISLQQLQATALNRLEIMKERFV